MYIILAYRDCVLRVERVDEHANRKAVVPHRAAGGSGDRRTPIRTVDTYYVVVTILQYLLYM